MKRCPRVHLKAAVFDGIRAYAGSANLTGAGFGAKGKNRRNFEIGFIINGGYAVEKITELFESIWAGEKCRECGRKRNCPVPLEEPDL